MICVDLPERIDQRVKEINESGIATASVRIHEANLQGSELNRYVLTVHFQDQS